MVTSVQMYNVLKEQVGEEAARMIVEQLARADDVATKTDIAGVNHNIEMLGLRLEARISASEARTFRWMLGFFATLYLGTAGMIVTLVLKL
jgi:hypothetical protein